VVGKVRIRINPGMGDSVQLEKEPTEVALVDISILGVGLLSKTFLPTGTVVDMEFPGLAVAVPNEPPPPEVLKFTAKIMYSRPQGDLCRMGLMITEISEESRSAIKAFAFSRELRREPRTPLP